MTYHFCVAGFIFAVELPCGCDVEALLPSFTPFRHEGACDNVLFRFVAGDDALPAGDGELWDETTNDLGFTRLYNEADGYRVELQYTPQGPVHTMVADRRFTAVRAHLCMDDAYAGQALSSLLRLTFAQAVVWHRAVSIHASVVVRQGRGYLFMGQSGTGKSTHSRLWLQNIAGCHLLNDDNPVLRIVGDEVVVYGSPWSGKTHCYRNEQYPVGAMVRLQQAPANRYRKQAEVGAFVALLPGCSVVRRDAEQYDALCNTVADIAGMVNVGVMECLPNAEAALMCFEKSKDMG